MGEAGSKHVISIMQGDGMIIYVLHSKVYFRKSVPSIIGLVIDRTKYCCVRISLSITKSIVIILFVMDFLPVGSDTSNYFSFCTSPTRY